LSAHLTSSKGGSKPTSFSIPDSSVEKDVCGCPEKHDDTDAGYSQVFVQIL
jgi:hypothetical protein